MRKVIEFSVKNSLFVNLLSIFIFVGGLLCMFALRRDAFPNVDYDIVMVQTNYFGAPPEEVEKLITIELEDELKEVDGIDEMSSVSSENISIVVIKIDPDEKDKTKIINDIQRAVDRADDLPEDADDPVVTEIKSKNFPVINVSISGLEDEHELQALARQLEIEILDLPDVASVDRIGWRDREIWVEVDPERVGKDKLALEDVILALRAKNLNLPGGTLTTAQGDYLVRTIGEFSNADEISRVIIRANDLGNWIRVSDVAHVRDTFEDDSRIEKTFGTKAINLTVLKKEKGDILRLVKDVKETSEQFKKNSAVENLKISYFDDYSYYVRRRLNVLKNNGIVGMVFVILALLFFLTRTVALMTTLGIPVALMGTFFIMYASGMTINLITMFGLIMVLGMVVDDAIIVSENVYRHVQEGMPPREAAVTGASEVAVPVISTVLTTIVAFVPLLFMSGIIGKFIWAIPVVVIIALITSLFECMVILPSHLADCMKPGEAGGNKDNQKWFKALQKKYTDVLSWVLSHKYKAVCGFLACFVGAILLYVFSMKFILFPQGLIEEFFIRIKAPIGTSLEETGRRMELIEKELLKLKPSDLDNFVTQVGIVREDPSDPYTDRGSHIGQVHVFLTPEKTKGRRHADTIIDGLRRQTDQIKGVFDEISYTKVRAGPPVGKPVSIRVRGDNLEKMSEVADQIKARLMQIKGLKDIRDDYDPGKTELRIVVDEEKASKAYLTITEVANTVRNAIDGGIATTIRKTDEEIDVIVRYPKDQTSTKEIFERIYIPNRFANLVPLTKVAVLKEVQGVNAIKHFDRKRMINVTADLDENVVTPIAVQKIIKTYVRDVLNPRYPKISISFGGEQEETNESLHDFLRALVLALFLIFIILAANFNSILRPLIVMMAIPFGLVGVIITFFLHGQPLSFMAMLGMIGLSGVVVNDAIVLVDFIGSLREKGMDKMESILKAGQLRLRPVILTTVTTIVGLLPVAYGIGGGDPFLKPMALTVGWGLLFATVLTLVLIPCVYSISDDAVALLSRIKGKLFKQG